jgi:uncharacterized SAM-binding protein YcdF (DUF218 family)
VILGPLRLALKIVGAIIGVVALYFAITFVQIWHTGRQHSSNDAEAILVFGTAEDDGRPSPELADRLGHTLALFESGRAPLVAVTGGKRAGDLFTEAGVSATWLVAHGVPRQDIVVGGGDDTWQNVSSVAPALKRRGVTTVLTVTDPFHEYRAMAITSDHGLTPYPSPVTNSAVGGTDLLTHYVKETLEVGVARVVGYENLSHWLHD